jgi:hypothetical protein
MAVNTHANAAVVEDWQVGFSTGSTFSALLKRT